MLKSLPLKLSLLLLTLIFALFSLTSLVACSRGNEKNINKTFPDSATKTVTQLPLIKAPTPFIDAMLKVTQPLQYSNIKSPLDIRGQARGQMYFEAIFSISIEDSNGKILGTGIATAKGDWMTEDFVPFESEITFTNPETKTGFVVLHKSNASGLPENDKEFKIPVNF